LVTVEGLRADTAESALPRAAASFSGNGACRGTAIAASSATAPALASLLTGLNPWRHRVLLDRQSLGEEFRTLAEALQSAGYATQGFQEASTLATARKGFAQGFDRWAHLREGQEAAMALRALAPGGFVWVHLVAAANGYRVAPEDVASANLDASWARRARRGFRRSVLQQASDRGQMTPELAELARAAYRHTLGAVDQRLARLLGALGESKSVGQTTVILVGVQGDPLGSDGQWQRGRDLQRGSIEVPFWIRSPEAVPPGCTDSAAPPSARLVFARLLERAGQKPPPGVAASRGSATSESFSELYRLDGFNRFSWVTDSRLFQWRTRLDPVGAEARRLGRRRERPYRSLFPLTAPLSGGSLTSSVVPWTPTGGEAAAVAARPATDEELARFKAVFLWFVDRERAPQDEVAEVP
jgi:arylsulfatase A-like enzyme